MHSIRNRPLASGALFIFLALCLAACSVPLAPGYEVRKENLSVQFVVASSPHLAIRFEYLLRNVGNGPLHAIRVALPGEKTYAQRNLRIEFDGREITPQPPRAGESGGETNSAATIWRIPFDPPWPQKQSRTLVIEYELAPAPPGGSAIAVNENSFHLRPRDWFPVLQTPQRLFSHDVERPDPVPVSVRVPEGFLVYSGGEFRGTQKQGGELEYRYRLHKLDPDPFVVAGRYHEQQIKTAGGTVIFWTFAPLQSSVAQSAGAQLAATCNAFVAAFGPLERYSDSIFIAETEAEIPSPIGRKFAGRPFPGGTLLNHEAFAISAASEDFLELAEGQIAQSWLGERVELRPDAQLVMGTGFSRYARFVAAEARGGAAARREAVAKAIGNYDEARAQAAEKSLLETSRDDPVEQRRIAVAKGELFFIAIEDECGEVSARRGIAHLVHALSRSEASFGDLRAALELESGKNLVAFFSEWLGQKGIPDGFRNRYPKGTE